MAYDGTGTPGYVLTANAAGTLASFQPITNNLDVEGSSGSVVTFAGITFTVKSPPYLDKGITGLVSLNSGSFVTAAIALTLPSSPGDGDLCEFVCTTAGSLAVTAAGTQLIRIGNQISSAGGTMTSIAIGDSVSLRYRTADTTWYATSVIGSWTPA
jgi:hypothetical protein